MFLGRSSPRRSFRRSASAGVKKVTHSRGFQKLYPYFFDHFVWKARDAHTRTQLQQSYPIRMETDRAIAPRRKALWPTAPLPQAGLVFPRKSGRGERSGLVVSLEMS